MSDEAPQPPHPPKQPYAAPVLVTYGDVVALTKNVGFSGKKDGGKFFKSRTR